MPDSKDEKLIRKYDLLSVIMLPSLILSLLFPILLIPLEMINDMVFDAQGFFGRGIAIILGVCGVMLVLFCYAILSLRAGLTTDRWYALEAQVSSEPSEPAFVASAEAAGLMSAGRLMQDSNNEFVAALGDAAAAAGAAKTVSNATVQSMSMRRRICRVRDAYGIAPVPRGPLIAAIILIPISLLIGTYIPQYMDAYAAKQAQIQAVSETQTRIADAFTAEGYTFSAADPTSTMRSEYTISCYRDDDSNTYIRVAINRSGTVTEIDYHRNVDLDKSKNDRLAVFNDTIRELNRILVSADVPVDVPALLSYKEVPDELIGKYLRSSGEVDTFESETFSRIHCSLGYYIEDFTEYSPPYFYFSVQVEYRSR